MNFIYILIPENICNAIGWTIFHSLWQGVLVSIILGVSVLLVDKKSARFRYALAASSMLLMFIFSVITFSKVYQQQPNLSSSKANTFLVYQNLSDESQTYDAAQNKTDSFFQPIKSIQKYFEDYLPLIVTGWLAGLLIFSIRFMGGIIYIHRLKTHGVQTVDLELESLLPQMIDKIKFGRPIKLFKSILVHVPITIGYLKPVILLPLGIIGVLPQNQIEAIIAHEIAHIKRYDFIVNIFQTLAETVFFYHPMMWWISSVIRAERENCCDDIAIELCGNPVEYSKALVNIQEMNNQESPFALAAIGKSNQLFRRIKRMNANKKTNLNYGIKFALFTVLILCIAIASLYSTNTYGSESKNANTASFVNPFTPIDNLFLPGNIENERTPAALRDTTNFRKGKRTFRFNENNGDNKTSYKAKLNNGKLEKLYIDEEEIPQNELSKYENKVNTQIDNYESILKDYQKKKDEYKKLSEQYVDELKEYREKLRNYSNRHLYLGEEFADLSEVRKAMRELRNELRESFENNPIEIPPVPPINIPEINLPDLNIPEIHIPPINIPPIHINAEDCYGWQDGLNESMEEFNEQMKENKWQLNNFSDSMKVFGNKMSVLGKEMEKFGKFFKAAKREMIEDELIDSRSDLEDFELSNDKMSVNGKNVSPELRKKYLAMYEEYTGKKIDGENKVSIHN
jgi:bla regulator protein blaR1